jgi:hypothetical protein
MSNPFGLTILFSVNALIMTKTIRRDRKSGKLIKSAYGRESHFRVKQVELRGFDHLCTCLDKLTQRPHAFVVRGEPLPGTDLSNTRRLLYPDPETGEVATFAAAARHCFAVDIDKVRKPVAVDPVSDPDGAVEHLIGLLPPELHDASCWWQFTCSQSLPGSEDTLSARLWFWSHDPLDEASLTRWALAANKSIGSQVIDPSLYRAVQPHYLADPVFENMVDPLARRHGVRVGLDTLVSLLIPEALTGDPYVVGEGYIGIGVNGHLAEIGGHRGFRGPMLSAIAAYFTGNPGADPERIKINVREAVNRADPGGRSATNIARYCSDRHLDDFIRWIRARERTRPTPTPSAFVDGLRGLAQSAPEAAVARLADHLLRRYVDPVLAVDLCRAWNSARCQRPLQDVDLVQIVDRIGERELTRRGCSGGR